MPLRCRLMDKLDATLSHLWRSRMPMATGHGIAYATVNDVPDGIVTKTYGLNAETCRVLTRIPLSTTSCTKLCLVKILSRTIDGTRGEKPCWVVPKI